MATPSRQTRSSRTRLYPRNCRCSPRTSNLPSQGQRRVPPGAEQSSRGSEICHQKNLKILGIDFGRPRNLVNWTRPLRTSNHLAERETPLHKLTASLAVGLSLPGKVCQSISPAIVSLDHPTAEVAQQCMADHERSYFYA